MKNFGFGIIGTGSIAAIHAKAILAIPEAKLIGVYNRTYEKALDFSESYSCHAYKDLDNLLEDENITILCICSASGTHLEIAERAIRAGKHCLIEKPLEITVDRCQQIIQLAEEYQVKIGTVFPTRFYPNSKKIKAKLTEGAFGTLVMGSAYIKWHRAASYYQSAAWRGTWALDGGGALMNQGIHALDMLLWYMGPVEFVQALKGNSVHQSIEVEDSLVAQLQFKNGALGAIECTTAAYPGSAKKIEIIGSTGSAVLTENQLTQWDFQDHLNDSELQVTAADKMPNAGASDPMAISHYGHQLQIQDFIDAIAENRKPFVDAAEGLKSVAVICAIYKSAEEGRRIYL